MTELTSNYAWHVHHDVQMELLTEPIEVRRQYIREHKPEHEQELRLRLLQPVRGRLPTVLDQAWAYNQTGTAYNQARAAFVLAGTAFAQARVAYNQARAACDGEIDTLHAAECPDCPFRRKGDLPTGGLNG